MFVYERLYCTSRRMCVCVCVIAREVESTKLFPVVTTESYVNVEHAYRTRTLLCMYNLLAYTLPVVELNKKRKKYVIVKNIFLN